MSDLQVFPISLPGGINQSAPLPTEGDLEELLNFGIFRNRVGLRAPIQLVATLLDDQGIPAEVTSVLDITAHEGALYVASHSTTTDKVYLHSMQVDGSGLTLEAVLWSGVVNRPTVTLTSYEGGTAGAGTSRLYAADYNQNLATVYWNGATVTTLTSDLDNDNIAENIFFSLMISYKFHLWGTGFYEAAAIRPEMVRFTQPGSIPATDASGGLNPKEWHSVDHRSVGRRGDKIVAVATAGDRLILFQKRATHAVYGSGASTWTRQELSGVVGCVGPHAVATVDERVAYFWASDGPYRTDGTQLQYIGDPIRQFAVETDADEYETRVSYSPDDGLVYFVVSPGGQNSYHLVFVFDHRRERWMRSIWFDGAGAEVQFGAFTAMDSAAAPGPAAPPSTLAAVAASHQQINLTWVNGDINVNNETHIYRDTSGGFTPNDATNRIGVVQAGVAAYSDTTGLSADTPYFYKLRHWRNSSHSAESNQATDTTWLAPPTGVGLAGLTGGLRITGTNPVIGGNVVIQRKVAGGAYSTIQTLVTPGASFSYDDTGLTCGTVYYYRTKTQLAGSDDSVWTADVSRAACEATTPPADPSGLTLGTVTQNSIAMSWTDNSDNEDEFQIYRSDDGGSTYFFIQSVGQGVVNYTNHLLTSYTEYYYKVKAVNAAGSSNFTTPINATTTPDLTAPTDLLAVTGGENSIDLTWSGTAPDAENWWIYRDGVFLTSAPATPTSFTDTDLSSGTSFAYKVKAVAGAYAGAFSNESIAATTNSQAPTAPTSLTATKNVTFPESQIDLAWTDNALDESEYEVWRKQGTGGSFILIDTIAANSESYNDTTVDAGTTYTYYVRACNGFGCRSSNQASETTDGSASPPSTPTSFTTTGDDADLNGVETSAVDMTWVRASTNEEYFIIQRKQTGQSDTSYAQIAQVAAGSTSYRDTTVIDSATAVIQRDYRIKAVNSAGDSAWSPNTTATIEPRTTPSGLTAVDDTQCVNGVSTPFVAVNWASGDTTGLEMRYLEREIAGSGNWAVIQSWATPINTFYDTTVQFGYTYRYRVRDEHGTTGENTGTFISVNSSNVTCIVTDCGGPE